MTPEACEIEIGLPDGTIGTICIEKGDDPIALARLFVAEKCLNQSYLEPLTAFIQDSMKRLSNPDPPPVKRTVKTMNEASTRLSQPFPHQQKQSSGVDHATSADSYSSCQKDSKQDPLKSGSASLSSHSSDVFNRLYSAGLSTMKKRSIEQEERATHSSTQKSSVVSSNSASERLYQQGLERSMRVEKLYLQKKQLQDELPPECTFKPEILKFSKNLMTKDSVIQRLTVNAPTAYQANQSRLQQIIDEEQTRECTFKPKLSKTLGKRISIKAQYKMDINRNGTSSLDRLVEIPTKKQTTYSLAVPIDLTLKAHEAKRIYGPISRLSALP